jgi:hypothetical protein
VKYFTTDVVRAIRMASLTAGRGPGAPDQLLTDFFTSLPSDESQVAFEEWLEELLVQERQATN